MKVWLWLGLSKVFIGCYFFFFSHLEVDFQVFPNFVTLQYLSAFEFPGYELIAAQSPGIKHIHGFISYGNFQVLKQKANITLSSVSTLPFWDHVNWHEWRILFSHRCAFCLGTLLWMPFGSFFPPFFKTDLNWGKVMPAVLLFLALFWPPGSVIDVLLE